MGAEHHRHVVGNLRKRFDKDRTLRFQRIHDISVMDDLVPDIAGRAEAFDRQPDDAARSEKHTSELQSLMRNSYAVFCLKKKNIANTDQQMKLLMDRECYSIVNS